MLHSGGSLCSLCSLYGVVLLSVGIQEHWSCCFRSSSRRPIVIVIVDGRRLNWPSNNSPGAWRLFMTGIVIYDIMRMNNLIWRRRCSTQHVFVISEYSQKWRQPVFYSLRWLCETALTVVISTPMGTVFGQPCL